MDDQCWIFFREPAGVWFFAKGSHKYLIIFDYIATTEICNIQWIITGIQPVTYYISTPFINMNLQQGQHSPIKADTNMQVFGHRVCRFLSHMSWPLESIFDVHET